MKLMHVGLTQFQFYISTIKGRLHAKAKELFEIFQFYISTIKGTTKQKVQHCNKSISILH